MAGAGLALKARSKRSFGFEPVCLVLDDEDQVVRLVLFIRNHETPDGVDPTLVGVVDMRHLDGRVAGCLPCDDAFDRVVASVQRMVVAIA